MSSTSTTTIHPFEKPSRENFKMILRFKRKLRKTKIFKSSADTYVMKEKKRIEMILIHFKVEVYKTRIL